MLHIWTAPTTRTRAKCPFHKRMCYGERQEFYDTTRVLFDCGAMVDYGYGYWRKPDAVIRAKRRAAYQRRNQKRLEQVA